MTLHEAIIRVFHESGESNLTPPEIAKYLNRTKWYSKKDNSIINSNQISARVKNYENLFIKKGNLISLKNNFKKDILPSRINITSNLNHRNNIEIFEKILLNDSNFKLPKIAENIIPNTPGIYCIRINQIDKLPENLANVLKLRNHNILYFGIASESLKKRFLNQELRAKGHGTFFRSIGAILGYKPEKGSLLLKSNKRNFKFKKEDEILIIDWINTNLRINWINTNNDLSNFETRLIVKYKPLINIAKNPNALKAISNLRSECVRIANLNSNESNT